MKNNMDQMLSKQALPWFKTDLLVPGRWAGAVVRVFFTMMLTDFVIFRRLRVFFANVMTSHWIEWILGTSSQEDQSISGQG